MSNGIIKLHSTVCSILLDEDADINERVLRTLSNGKKLRVEIFIVEDAGKPFADDVNINTQESFCFDCFNPIENQKGVYVFQEKNTGEVLYVGQGGFGRTEDSEWSLRNRVEQHYSRRNTAANFRINWAKSNCDECGKEGNKKCLADDNNFLNNSNKCPFPCYLKTISHSRVIFFCICNNDNAALLKQQACELENWLGCCLHSKYSSHKWPYNQQGTRNFNGEDNQV